MALYFACVEVEKCYCTPSLKFQTRFIAFLMILHVVTLYRHQSIKLAGKIIKSQVIFSLALLINNYKTRFLVIKLLIKIDWVKNASF